MPHQLPPHPPPQHKQNPRPPDAAANDPLFERRGFTLDDFKQQAEHLPVIAWVSDASGNLLYFNRRFYTYVGRHGLSCWDILHPDDKPSTARKWQRCMDTGTPYIHNCRLAGVDQEYRWFHEVAEPIREGGRVVCWVGTSIELPEQQAADAL